MRPSLPSVDQIGADKDLLAGMTTFLRGVWVEISDEEFDRIVTHKTMRLVVFGQINYKCIQDRSEVHYLDYFYDLESGAFIRSGGTINGQPQVEIFSDGERNQINSN